MNQNDIYIDNHIDEIFEPYEKLIDEDTDNILIPFIGMPEFTDILDKSIQTFCEYYNNDKEITCYECLKQDKFALALILEDHIYDYIQFLLRTVQRNYVLYLLAFRGSDFIDTFELSKKILETYDYDKILKIAQFHIANRSDKKENCSHGSNS